MNNFSRNKFFTRFQSINKNYDWVLLTVVITLCIAGLTFLASALSVKVQADFYKELLKQMIFGLWIGGFLSYILARVDYHNLFKVKNTLLYITIVLLAFLAGFAIFTQVTGMSEAAKKVFIDGRANPIIAPSIANGSIRWIDTPLLLVQPSELAKLTLLIFFAAKINEFKDQEITWMSLKRPFYAFFLISSLIIVQPDLGSIVLIFCILFSAMWATKVPMKILGIVVTIVSIFVLISSFTTGYRLSRIKSAYDTKNATKAENYQTKNAQKAISDGGLWGAGYGNSIAKQQGIVPESSTDAIISIIAEEMGFIFTTLFLSLYIVFCFRGLKIAREAPDVGGKALAVGITIWIVLQAFWNVGGIIGLAPLKGLPLPFVSEGGTALVLNLASVGILMNISSQKNENNIASQVESKTNAGKRRRFLRNNG
ncbi:MAG: FtsW/RodA/SpoVE family cell cycle protein [candidate division SR1 bacterium]|nr:FtsW/RodA/SpoVE family cell cycle protein [candidate division SR1 bacterium]